MSIVHACVCVFVYECVFSCIYTYTHPHTHTPTNKHTRTHTHTCIYLLTHIHTDLYRSTNIYAYVSMHARLHIYTGRKHMHIYSLMLQRAWELLCQPVFHTSLSHVKWSCTHPHTCAQLWRHRPLQAPVYTYWHWRHITREMWRVQVAPVLVFVHVWMCVGVWVRPTKRLEPTKSRHHRRCVTMGLNRQCKHT